MPNHHRHAPAFPLAATIIGLSIAVCIVIFCVKALLVHHQVVQDGERIKRLERELAEVNIKNEALQTRKEQLISLPALQKAVDTKFVNLVKIDEKFVINSSRAIAERARTQVVAKLETQEGR